MTAKNASLIKRELYLKKLISFQDVDVIKVITGIRRCGKSSLLKLMAKHLQEQGIPKEQIIEINFESMEFLTMNVSEFYQYIAKKIIPDKTMYLFFDEIQRLTKWQQAINSFRVDFYCDIYISGSNAFLLSSELSTYLSGRYVEIKVYPLSFREFMDFHGYIVKSKTKPDGTFKNIIYDANEDYYSPREMFNLYAKYGGMPALADIGLEQDKVISMLDGIYSAVVVRDILEKAREEGQRTLTDPFLLRKIIMFLADNIGNTTSISSIGNVLVSEKLLDEGHRKSKPATHTLQAYIASLLDAYVFYEIKRFDIKGKDYLRTLGKYYIVDIGLRNYLLGFREGDTGHIIENIVYFELLRQGYDVAIGKIDQQEIDFIATKSNEKKYIQVTESMNSPETRARELSPLEKVKDNYEKIVITLDSSLLQTQNGIKIIPLLDFLLE